MRSLDEITQRTSAVTGISVSEIRGRTRRREVAEARILAAFSAYRERHTAEAIAEYLDSRSVDDVRHLIRRARSLKHCDQDFVDQLRRISYWAARPRRPRRTDEERKALTREWLRLAHEEGMSKTQAAAEVGVCVQTLWTWSRRFRIPVDDDVDRWDVERYERMVMSYNAV